MNAITIKNLNKVYKNGTRALENIDLEVKKGDFFALLGANGAGKTTIIGILTGLVKKTSGSVQVHEFDIDEDLDKAKELIGVVPQEFNFNMFEKVIDIVVTQAGYFGIARKEALQEAEVLLKALSLWEKRNTPSRALSGGMKRRLMIARALIHKPKLLILDEPTAGVDVELRREMWDYLKKLNQDGTTILLTTHYLEEVEQLCKQVAIIKQGHIVRQDSVKDMIHSLEKQTYVVTVTKMLKGRPELEDYDISLTDENTLEVDLGMNQNISDFVTTLSENGITIKDFRPKENRLEQLFLKILKN